MRLLSIIRAVFVSSFAALPSSLLFLGYEGSVVNYVGWLWTAVLVLIFAFIGCVLFGLPIHFFMQSKQINSRLTYVIVGFLTPIVVMASGPILFMDWQELINQNNIEMTMVLAVAGAAVAVTFREMTAY